MNLMRKHLILWLCFWVLIASSQAGLSPVQADDASAVADKMLAAAEEYVERSDRYLHHSKLRRGMKGYGLTVLAGTDLVRFDAEIVSVQSNMIPRQDLILAKLSGQGLAQTGVIAGMSGSPVYVTDPADGADKMIGAVAFSWSFQQGAVCGIQPITQMLAGSGMFDPTDKSGPETTGRAAARIGRDAFLAAALDPEKIDFVKLALPAAAGPTGGQPRAGPQLRPLVTPLMVAGGSSELLGQIEPYFASVGMVPIASGGVGQDIAAQAAETRLEPGSSVAVTLMSGDMDFTAVGTVTDVIDDRVLAFGHAMLGWGQTQLPMGTAYVHTVVSSRYRSFKLGSTLKINGALERDEYVGVSGRIGAVAPMIPVSVTIDWPYRDRTERYNYRIVRDSRFSPLLAGFAVTDSAQAWHGLPKHHTIHYKIDLDYGELGSYSAENISSDTGVFVIMSDLSRPIWAMMSNPFGPSVAPRSINCQLKVTEGNTEAELLDMKLDGRVYKPGETLTGRIIYRPFRKPRRSRTVSFKLPDDLPDGQYTLTACNSDRAITLAQQEMPHLYSPRTVAELLASINRVVSVRSNRIYLRLPLKRKGLALGTDQMPELPPSRAQIVRQAGLLDTYDFSETLERSVGSQYVISGSVGAEFEVQRRPSPRRLR